MLITIALVREIDPLANVANIKHYLQTVADSEVQNLESNI